MTHGFFGRMALAAFGSIAVAASLGWERFTGVMFAGAFATFEMIARWPVRESRRHR